MSDPAQLVVFAHGLESSPGGTKATYLKEEFGAFTPPLFELGLKEQVGALNLALEERKPCVLVGSSLGGLASLGAVNKDSTLVSHLVLLAPAVGVHRHKDAFKEAEKTRPGLRAEAMEIATLSIPKTIPTTIIHGIHDEVVNKNDVVDLSTRSPSSTLILVQDDHMLKESKNLIISVIGRVSLGKNPIVL